jgi:hypothetical protein
MFGKRKLSRLGNAKPSSRHLGRDDGAGAQEDHEGLRVTGGITAFTCEVIVTIVDVYNGNEFVPTVHFHTLDGIAIALFDPRVDGEERIVNIMVGECIARDLEVID